MSTGARVSSSPSNERTARPRADLRRFDRIVAAILMPVGPAAVAVLRYILPGEPIGESVAANPGAQRAALWLGVVALFTLLPGAYAAFRLVRRRAPRLTAWSAALLVPGYLAMTALYAGDAFALAGTELGLDARLVDRVLGGILVLPTTGLLLIVFVVFHIGGTVLLGSAMLAARAVPVLAGIAMVVSQPVHLAAVVANSRPLDLIGWGLTAVAMGFLSWRALRTPNEEWDLPPAPRAEP